MKINATNAEKMPVRINPGTALYNSKGIFTNCNGGLTKSISLAKILDEIDANEIEAIAFTEKCLNTTS